MYKLKLKILNDPQIKQVFPNINVKVKVCKNYVLLHFKIKECPKNGKIIEIKEENTVKCKMNSLTPVNLSQGELKIIVRKDYINIIGYGYKDKTVNLENQTFQLKPETQSSDLNNTQSVRSDPVIISITPSKATPGKELEVYGSNFDRDNFTSINFKNETTTIVVTDVNFIDDGGLIVIIVKLPNIIGELSVSYISAESTFGKEYKGFEAIPYGPIVTSINPIEGNKNSSVTLTVKNDKSNTDINNWKIVFKSNDYSSTFTLNQINIIVNSNDNNNIITIDFNLIQFDLLPGIYTPLLTDKNGLGKTEPNVKFTVTE